MFLPWLYKPFNLSTVEKLVGVILAMLTYWIDYPVGMATLFMLCGAVMGSMKGHPKHLKGQTYMQDTGQLISNYKLLQVNILYVCVFSL